MPRVLVTGAFGFLGRHVTRRWAQEDWHVTGLGHGDWTRESWRNWGVDDWHMAEVTLDTLATYGGEPDVIVHCAGSGSVSFSVIHPYQDFQRTTLTTAAVLEYVRLHSPHTRVVFPSSAAVYGVVNRLPIAETAALAPVSPYGVHKRLAEELCQSYANTFKLQVSIVRFFSLYGLGLRKQLMWDACCKLATGEARFAGTGNELRDWIHVTDAAELLACAATRAGQDCPVFNGGSGRPITVQEVVSRLSLMFPGVPALFTGDVRPGDPHQYQADVSRTHALGWRPLVELDDGIAEYGEWYKAGAK